MVFSNTDIIIGVLAVAVIILAITVFYQERQIKKILKGKNAKDLEDSFNFIEKEYKEMKKFRDDMSDYLKNVESRLKKSVQGLSIVRFNAWKGTGDGGNQSFASAFLSENGNGIILSSLHSRDRVSIFAKPVKAGKSSYELTDEEKSALDEALKNVRDQQK